MICVSSVKLKCKWKCNFTYIDFYVLMSMCKKNLNWLYAFVFVITSLKFDLKKTWKVDFLVYPIWYRCATKVKQVCKVLAGKVALQVIIVQSQYVKVSFNDN